MPKSTKSSGGKKQKLQLSNKQFEELLKEIGGSLPEGMNMDPSLLEMLRQATDSKFNEVAKEKYGEIPEDERADEEDSVVEEVPEDSTKEEAVEKTDEEPKSA